MEQYQYLPLSGPSFLLLVAIFVFLLLLIQLGVLQYAYTQLGISSGGALALLFASLIGSYLNIPITELPGQRIVAEGEVSLFGMHYIVPELINRPGTVLAVNVGGAVIPTLMSIYLLLKYRFGLRAAIATALVAVVCYALSQPIRGAGIAEPVFVPAIATAVVALVLGGRHAAALAYVCGSLGTLIGADLLNLGAISGLGAPIASIGGAGTFDGIFLIGIFAVLIASLVRPAPAAPL